MKSVKLNLVKSSSKKLKEKEMKIISGGADVLVQEVLTTQILLPVATIKVSKS